MKTVTLEIDDNNFLEIENILSTLNKPRNRYINEAIEYYNEFQKRTLQQKKLESELEISNNPNNIINNSLFGILSKYKNTELISLEKDAWKSIVVENNGNS